MAENYTVNYNINVNSTEAIAALNSFKTAVSGLGETKTQLDAFSAALKTTMTSFQQFAKSTPVIKFNTATAKQQLDAIIKRLETIKELAGQSGMMLGSAAANTGKGGNKGSKSGSSNKGGGGGKGGSTYMFNNGGRTPKETASGFASKRPTRVAAAPKPAASNLAYKALGPSMLDSGGIGILSMLKGMGVAYGITGLGAAMGSALKDAIEYNNIITTTRNILNAHDKSASFNDRFAAMERVIRNVGIETKFTAPEVADASRFLAMAGFNVNDINQSIRPIADIALVGDTDLGETADVVTNIMTGYGIKSSDVRHAADIMTQTFTMSNTTLMEIAESYKYAASLLSAGGVSFEEATAAIGILGNAGIKGSQAGTSMRTILANLVNPTKKQRKAWEELGIERFDKNGNLRDLVDIFSDLNASGVGVDRIYRMFNRTAAQGAISLIAHVDEWNEIIKENFMSEGLTAELAEAKKNTIQGLWAQLTSMFTENGMKTFEGLQEEIRRMLQGIIDWLKTDDAYRVMKSLGDTFFDLVGAMKTFTGILTTLYMRFRPLLSFWLKAQLVLSSILIPLRTFRALINFGAYAFSAARSVGTLALSFNRLNIAIRRTFTNTYGLKGLFAKIGLGMGIGSTHIAFTKPVDSSTLRYQGGVFVPTPESKGRLATRMMPNTAMAYVPPSLRTMGKQIAPYAGGIGGMVGMGLGSWYGSQLGGDNAAMNILGSVLGGAAGMVGGSWLASGVAPWLVETAVPFLLTNPVGWGLLVTGALAGCVASFVSYQNAVEEANEANQKYLASTSSINGISLSEHASTTDKYLSIIYNKQMSVNEKISEHINLIREQLGIMSEADKKLSDKTLGETHKEELENAAKPFKGLWSTEQTKRDAAFAPVYFPNSDTLDPFMTPMDMGVPYGNNVRFYRFNGRDFSGNSSGAEQIAAAKMLASLGRDLSQGSDLYKSRQNINKYVLGAKNLEDFNVALRTGLQEGLIPSYLSDSKNWRITDLENKPESEWKRSYDYVTAFNSLLRQEFNLDRPESSANAQMLVDLKNILTAIENDKVTEEILTTFLGHSGALALDPSFLKAGAFGSDAYMRQFGWLPDQKEWGHVSYVDPKTGKQLDLTSEQAKQAFMSFHQQIIDIVNRLNPRVREYFYSFLNNPIWQYTGDSGNGNNGEATLDGVKYKWDPASQKWVPDSTKGMRRSLTNAEMQKELGNTAGSGNASGFGGGGGTSGVGGGGKGKGAGSTGAKASDYKNHYNSGSAAPKQVIVRIANLMNVEKVDLSNPDNVAVINNLKSELTQALVDVVHDFDETWHG